MAASAPLDWYRDHGALLAVLSAAAFLNVWNLSANGYGNSYYAAPCAA